MAHAFKNCSNLMVTGANRGLGLQIVETLATGGFSPGKIIATARNPDGAKELQKLAGEHQNIHIIKLDVTSQESIESAASEVEQLVQKEGLNCLINNAGINVVANLETVTADKMLENFHTNSVAPLMITKAVLPLLKRAAAKGTGMGIHRAAVINMTSLLGSVELYWGDRANSFKWYPYRTSKSALNMVTRCLAVDLEADGILCMALHPGWVRTDMGGPDVHTWQKDMIIIAILGLSFGGIHLTFSEELEYGILGISVVLFLMALCLLIWQIYRFCTQIPISQRPDSLLARSGGFQYATQTNDAKMEVFYEEMSHRLSPGTSNMGSTLDLASMEDLEEENIQGSLRFSLFYDQLQSKLVVTVLDAQDLAVREFSNSVDPFVWVRDFDKYSRHGVLGEARAALNSLKLSYPLELREDLQVPKKDMVGEALLSLKYLPTSQRLEVGVLKIRTICHPKKTMRALYARTSVTCNHCKLRHQRTAQKQRWEVTVFNEVLTFVLPDQQIRECTIIVSVYEIQPSKKSFKRLIGHIHIKKAKTSENEHWTLMMQSLRQPIAKWHLIFI
ncbi:synaptotagmin-2-like protein [Labeo rohita]|uniref:Synaptotagmin-2-like protein n=1 Tax=Labeo rohita TaxID=84645 RepID=A0A498MEJ6_LABRO|nr:synaptotagmin-2-like protein [Labeo rohita]